VRITSLQNPRLQLVRRLVRDARERRETGLCVVEGPRIVAEILGMPGIETVLACPETLDAELPDLLRSLRDSFPDTLIEVDARLLAACSDAKTPQGVLVVVRAPRHAGLPTAGDAPVLVGWELQDPGNVGTLVRSAEASGCGAVLLAGGDAISCADPFSPRAVRASAGSVLRVPVFEWSGDPAQLASLLAAAGRRVVAALAHGGMPPERADLRGGPALVVGAETRGLPQALLAHAIAVTIPLAGRCESLNAGVAASVLAFEAARQRRAQQPGAASP
jgi:TrmH family RNA methyltransferase